jgi:hypothetical protein
MASTADASVDRKNVASIAKPPESPPFEIKHLPHPTHFVRMIPHCAAEVNRIIGVITGQLPQRAVLILAADDGYLAGPVAQERAKIHRRRRLAERVGAGPEKPRRPHLPSECRYEVSDPLPSV